MSEIHRILYLSWERSGSGGRAARHGTVAVVACRSDLSVAPLPYIFFSLERAADRSLFTLFTGSARGRHHDLIKWDVLFFVGLSAVRDAPTPPVTRISEPRRKKITIIFISLAIEKDFFSVAFFFSEVAQN